MLPIRLPTFSPRPPEVSKANGPGRTAALCLCVALLAAGCSRGTPEPRAAAQPGPSPTPAPRATGHAGCAPPRAASPELAPHYDMEIEVLLAEGAVTGTSDVTFAADRATSRLVFRLWPNGPRLSQSGAELVVDEARLVTGEATVERPDPTTLVFELGTRLPPGETVTAHLGWRLDLPGAILDRISQNGDAVRLGSFFPILSWQGERGWATDPPTTTLAESSTSPTADFDVGIQAPPGLDVLATGAETGPGRWSARDVRDFAVAVGDFEVVRTTVDAPAPVQVTTGVAAGVDADPQEFSDAVARALRDLSDRYGAYPWPTFSMAIMPDLGAAGIEYPSMVFQGEGSLEHATTHEVAHSWFYGLVGNDQARDPWLDEGLASWAQARSDGILGYFRDFDVGSPARGRLGKPMRYWDSHQDAYYGGVYVQGVKALDALGKDRRVDCALKGYVAANAYGVAEPGDLVDALERRFPRAARVLARFGARPRT